VPLLIRLPEKVPAGIRIQQPVSLVSLPRTVLDLVGLPAELPGEPLPHREQDGAGGEAFDEPLLAEFNPAQLDPHVKSFLNSRWHYILSIETGCEELYDWRNDCEELYNLAGSLEQQSVLEEFRKRMRTHIPQWPAQCAAP